MVRLEELMSANDIVEGDYMVDRTGDPLMTNSDDDESYDCERISPLMCMFAMSPLRLTILESLTDARERMIHKLKKFRCLSSKSKRTSGPMSGLSPTVSTAIRGELMISKDVETGAWWSSLLDHVDDIHTDDESRELESETEADAAWWSKLPDDVYVQFCTDVRLKEPKAALEDVENSIWNRLPEDVVCLILARLPLQRLAQCRTVCRKWNAVWDCDKFWELRSEMCVPSEKLWIFSFRPWVPVMYYSSSGARELENTSCNFYGRTKTSLNRFFRRRGSQPNPKLHVFNPAANRLYKHKFCNLQLPALECYLGCHKVVATAGGLIFRTSQPWPGIFIEEVREYDHFEPDMMVGNPLKENAWTPLPRRDTQWKPDTRGMVFHPKTNAYKVLLASEFGTEVYDSVTKAWTLSKSEKTIHDRLVVNVRAQPPLAEQVTAATVCCQGCLFYVGAAADRGDYSGAVHMYDPEKDEWNSFSLPSSPHNNRIQFDWAMTGTSRDAHFSELQECGDRLFVVGYRRSMEQDALYAPKQPLRAGLFVWERVSDGDFVNGEWKLIGSPSGCTKFPYLRTRDGVETKDGKNFVAGSKPNDLLCYTLADHTNFFLYSISRNEWWSVYKNGCNQQMDIRSIFSVYANQPRLCLPFYPRMDTPVQV